MIFQVVLPSRPTALGAPVPGPRSMTEVRQYFIGGRRVAYTDRTLTCADCGTNFTFSADDQAYHDERGFTNEPKRCPDCRATRRGQQGQSSYGGGGGGGSYGGQ